MIEKVGRKNLLVFGLGVAAAAAGICAFDYNQRTLVIVLTSLFNMSTVVAWNSLNCFSVESFPTRIRSSTMGLLGAMGRVSAAIAQFSNAAMQKNVTLLLLVTAGALFVGASSAICITETAGQTLPDDPPSHERDGDNDHSKHESTNNDREKAHAHAHAHAVNRNPIAIVHDRAAEGEKQTAARQLAAVQAAKRKKGKHSRNGDENNNSDM